MNKWQHNLDEVSETVVAQHMRRLAGPGSGKRGPKRNVNRKAFAKLQARRNLEATVKDAKGRTMPGSLNPRKQA